MSFFFPTIIATNRQQEQLEEEEMKSYNNNNHPVAATGNENYELQRAYKRARPGRCCITQQFPYSFKHKLIFKLLWLQLLYRLCVNRRMIFRVRVLSLREAMRVRRRTDFLKKRKKKILQR